jgi:hypothetical protein
MSAVKPNFADLFIAWSHACARSQSQQMNQRLCFAIELDDELTAELRLSIISGVDLTFATHLAAGSSGECQIQNSTRNLYLLVVL